VNRFRGGLVFKAHRLVYHSTLGSRVMKRKKFGMLGRGCMLQLYKKVPVLVPGHEVVWTT